MKLQKKLHLKKSASILFFVISSIIVLTFAYRLIVRIKEQSRISKPVEVIQLTYGETNKTLPELTVNGFLEIRFEEYMDRESTEKALRILDENFVEVQGKVIWLNENPWLNGDILRFIPSQLLRPNSQYQILISTEAETHSGDPIQRVFDVSFQTVSRTEGVTLFPVEGATNVQIDDPIIVVFEEPVHPNDIPLNTLASKQVIELSPRIEGIGHWLNTSTYQFTPVNNLTSNTRYQVRVKASEINEIASDEFLLSEDILWQFETLPPQVSWIKINDKLFEPDDESVFNQPPEFLLSVKFDSSMNQPETEKRISLLTDDGTQVDISSFNWQEESSLLNFFLSSLELDTKYTLRIDEEALATDGGTIKEAFEWHFRTTSPPSVSYPIPNSTVDRTYFTDQLVVNFSSDIDPASLIGRVQVIPNHSASQEPYYYNRSSKTLTIFGLQPASIYEIHLLPGISDTYGNAINEEITFTLSSGELQPSTYIQLPSVQPAIYETGSPLDFYTTFLNVDNVTFKLFRLSREQYILLSDASPNPDEESVISLNRTASPIVNSTQIVTEETINKVTLTNSAEAGYYLISATAFDENQKIVDEDLRVVIVSNANLTLKAGTSEALIWLTDFERGQPLSNVDITLYKGNAQVVGKGTTDNWGLVHFEYESDFDANQIYYAVTEDRNYFAFARSNWSSGNEDYDQISVDKFVSFPNQEVIYLYTDRSVYRPGQTVFIKGIYRLETDLNYSLPSQSERIKIRVVRELGGTVVFEQEPELSAYKTVAADYILEPNAEPGNYIIQAMIDNVEIARVRFNVSYYQRQTFQVNTTVQQEDILAGSSFATHINASYFTGGSVTNADVTLTLSESPYIFEPKNELFQDYSFVNVDFLEQYSPSYGVQVAEYNLTTNEFGEADKIIPFTPSNSQVGQELTLNANVEDSAGNVAVGRDTIIIHPSTYYIGIRANEKIGNLNEPQPIDIAVLTWDESPVREQKVDINVIREDHYRAEVEIHGILQPEYSVQQTIIEKYENQLTDSSGRVSVNFTPTQPGIYRVEANTQDDAGNNLTTSIRVWIGDESNYLSSRFNIYKSATIVPNKETYFPGEIAEFLISSPFSGPSYALLTIERGQIQHYEIVELPESGNNLTYKLTITNDMAPNAFISILLLKGRNENFSRPTFAHGIHEIIVENELNQLDIEVNFESDYVIPGEKSLVTIVTKDMSGLPVQAELSVALVDLSIVNQSEPNSEPIFDYFYHQRSLDIKTALPMARFAEEFNYRIQNNIPTGETMGGGDLKGDGIIGVMEVREEFPDTAVWVSMLETDAKGNAVISIEIPDTITEWRIDVRGVTLDTKIGQTAKDIVASKPLYIVPETPRFLVAGDELLIGAYVGNITDKPMEATVTLAADGVNLRSNETWTKTISLSENSIKYVTWQIIVDANSTSADFTFSTSNDIYSDSSKPILGSLENNQIPVYAHRPTNPWVISGALFNAETINFEIPDLSSYENVDVHVEFTTSIINSLLQTLSLPKQIEELTVEEFVSSIFPIIHAQKTTSLLNESEIRLLTDEYLSQIYESQNIDGSWGWVKGLEGDTLTTAYVVLCLVESQEAGLQIDEASLLKGIDFLRNNLLENSDLRTPQQFDKQSFTLYVLTRQGGYNITDRLQNLFDNRAFLSLYAKSFLAQSFANLDPNDPRVVVLLGELRASLLSSDSGYYWSETSDDPIAWNTSLRTTALLLNTFITLDPDEPRLPEVAEWLLHRRTRNGWGTSQESAWTLIALISWARSNNELMQNFAYSASLNNETFFSRVTQPDTLTQTASYSFDQAQLSNSQPNVLSISRGDGPGTLYYTAFADTGPSQVSVPTTNIQGGIALERQYYAIDNPNVPVTEIDVGDFLVVELTVIVPKDLFFVSIQEFLPAGFDATIWSNDNVKFQELFDEFGWGLDYFSQANLNDESITIYAEQLTAGVYKYFYILRASTPGTFHVLPTVGQELYSTQNYSLSSESTLTVLP